MQTPEKVLQEMMEKMKRKNQNEEFNKTLDQLKLEKRMANLKNQQYLPSKDIVNKIINNINEDNYLQTQKIVSIMQGWGNQAQAEIAALKTRIVAEQRKILSGNPEKYSETIIRVNIALLKDKEKDLNEFNRSTSQLENRIKSFAPAIPKPLNLDEVNHILNSQQPTPRTSNQPRPQSAPQHQINKKDKKILEKPKGQMQKSQSMTGLNSTQYKLNNLQTDNINTSYSSNKALKTMQNWFSEKFSNISSALSNPFSSGSSTSTSNITNSINISTQKNNKFQAHAGQVVKNEKGNYR
jgi:hypothetical protein